MGRPPIEPQACIAFLVHCCFPGDIPSPNQIYDLLQDFKADWQVWKAQPRRKIRNFVQSFPLNPSNLPADMFNEFYPTDPPVPRDIDRMPSILRKSVCRDTNRLLQAGTRGTGAARDEPPEEKPATAAGGDTCCVREQ